MHIPAGKLHRSTLPLLLLSFSILTLTGAAPAQSPAEKAWAVLHSGVADKNTDERAIAVRVLGLLDNDPNAPGLALKALGDDKPEVRAAAADALGQMKAKSAAPKLAAVIQGDEKDVAVILACARSM